jgi:hypothetical protein
MGQGKNLVTHVTHRHHSRTLFLYTSSSSKVCSHRSLGSKIQKGEVVGWLGTAEHAGDGADTSSICTTLLNKPHSYCSISARLPLTSRCAAAYRSRRCPSLATLLTDRCCAPTFPDVYTYMCMLCVLRSACSSRQEYSCLSLQLLSMVHHPHARKHLVSRCVV